MKGKKLIKMVAVATVCVMAAGMLAGCNSDLDKAKSDYKTAVSALNERNAAIDAEIDEINALINGDEKPLDNAAVDAANAAIGAAQAAKITASEAKGTTEEVKAQTAEVEAATYTQEIAALDAAKKGMEDGIAQMKLVTNPSEAYVIQCLQGLPNITAVEAVTEGNDPNGKLGKQGGYTATVYFTSDLVDLSKVSGSDVISRGTAGGGAVEVYANVEDCEKRNTYLAAFDGTILSNGAHTICGTCLVRVSDELSASQQAEMTANIVAALTKLG